MTHELGTPVWKHLKNGKRRAMWLKRDHVCTKKCLVMSSDFGRYFSYCTLYSYRPEGLPR